MTVFRVIDDWDGGVGWIADPDESMERASHAIEGERGLWLVDPVDCEGLDEWLADYGSVAGVIICLDRHKRDADAIAARHEVAIHLQDELAGIQGDFRAPVGSIAAFTEETGWTAEPIISWPGWHEVVLVSPDADTIRVPEAVGTSPHMCAPGERLGIHPLLRLSPPRSLQAFAPERLLVGHGVGIMADASDDLADALANSRRRAPAAYLSSLRTLF